MQRFVVPKSVKIHLLALLPCFWSKLAWNFEIHCDIWDLPLSSAPHHRVLGNIWIQVQVLHEILGTTDSEFLDIFLEHEVILGGDLLHQLIDPPVILLLRGVRVANNRVAQRYAVFPEALLNRVEFMMRPLMDNLILKIVGGMVEVSQECIQD